MTPLISQRAFNAIVAFEVTSRAVYEKDYQHPTWPGGQSGVTVGIGYDLGYCSLEKLHQDWDGRLSDSTIKAMTRCLGVTGQDARDLCSAAHSLILVPWDAAIAVFSERDIPEWTAKVCRAVPGAEKLPPDCLGALVSLAYNRGDGGFTSTSDRFKEMRAIRQHVTSGELAKVPDDIRGMKRLWPTVKGLRDRRDAEAKMFADGLAAQPSKPVPTPDAPKTVPSLPPDVEPMPPKKPPAIQPEHAGSAIAVFIATIVSTLAHSWTAAALVFALGLIAAFVIYHTLKGKQS